MRSKKLVSALAALTMLSSAFSGLTLTVNAEDTTVTANLVHTASAQGGENTAGTFLDAETHHINLWGTSGWVATGYTEFSLDAPLTDSVKSATLTFSTSSSRGNDRDLDVALLDAETTATIDFESSIDMIEKPANIVASYDDITVAVMTKTVDVTDALADRIAAGETRFIFAYANANAGGELYGKASEQYAPKLEIVTTDAAIYDITINYVDEEGAPLKTETDSAVDGTIYTPEYETSFNQDGYKYTYVSGGDEIEITDNTTINLVYSKSELAKTTVTLNGSYDGVTEVISETEITEDDSVTIPYSKYVIKNDKLYTVNQAAMTAGTYFGYTVTGTAADQSATVPYTVSEKTPVFFSEVENQFADSEVPNSAIRCSNGGAYNFGTTAEEVVKLSAGTYEIEAAGWGNKNHTYSFKANDTEVLSVATTGSIAVASNSFTLEDEAVLTVTGDGSTNIGIDYILITGTGEATAVGGGEEPGGDDGEPTAPPTATPTVPPETVATTYVDESFTYEDQEIIKSAGNDVENAPDPVTMGNIVYNAGRRNNGPINNSMSIASNELYISADQYATGGRGVSFSFADSTDIPTMAELGPDAALEMSFKIKATNTFAVTGYGDITTADLVSPDYVNVRVILDNALNKQILIVSDTNGNILTSKVDELTAETLSGMTFFTGAGTYNVDDVKVSLDKSTVGLINATVTGADEATVTVGNIVKTTGTAGTSTYFAFPAGEYDVTASKSGYEHTQNMGDDHTVKVTVEAGKTADAAMSLSLRSYIKLPETVTIGGGQAFVAAAEETAKTAPFTVTVLDQYGIEMTTDEYTLEWAVYPEGTSANDGLVTIGTDGVVSVDPTFHTSSDTATYDVHAVVKTDDRGQDIVYKLVVGNNDIIYYEPVTWAVANTTRTATQNLTAPVTLPDMSAMTINLAMNYTEGQSTFIVKGDVGNIVGLQHTGTTIKAWTGWTGNSAFNQSGDVDAFTNSAVLVDGYVDGTPIDITFTIDKENNSVTVATGTSTVSLPLTATPGTITGFQMGQYRNYGGLTLTNVMVKEPNADYLAIVGDTDFAKVSGTDVTRQYSLSQSVIVPDETFTWTVAKTGEVSIAEDTAVSSAKFTVAASTEARTVKAYKAVYNSDNTLASLSIEDVNIAADQTEVVVEAAEGTKVMLWGANNQPLAAAVTASAPEATPTEAPTSAPTTPPGSGSVYISNDGLLTVKDTAEAGVYTITATSNISATKTASLEITIDDFQQVTNIEYTGSTAYDVTEETGTYAITGMTDKYGDDMTDLITDIKWSSSKTDVAEITPEGTLAVKGAGSTTVTATITNGTAVTILDIPVTVAQYYITGNATGNSTDVDTSALVAADSYVVTTATSAGVQVSQTTVSEKPSTVDTTGADKFEIAPVYATSDVASSAVFTVPADTYDFTVSGSGSRVDVYVNDQMIVNNLMQGGSVNANETVKDIVVAEGKAQLNLRDSGGSQTVSASFHKSPSIVTRVQKVFVLGDSLTCNYYNNQGPKDQTGWGQVIDKFIKNAEVVNLGNSGVTAVGLSESAITQPVMSGQPGDIVLLESGYNDRSYTTEEAMINALTSMYNAATAKGLKVIFLSPTASDHDYKESVAWTGTMASTASTLGAEYIDVSKLSFNAMYSLYGDNKTDMLIGIWNVSDGLHSTYDGAMKVASIIASEMIKLGLGDMINTDYSYTWQDAKGNNIVCQAAAE